MTATRRRGVALLLALAILTLLGGLAVALHAVALRERRAARRATLVGRVDAAAEGALAEWATALEGGDAPVDAAPDPPGTVRVLVPPPADDGAGGHARAAVTLVALGGGARLLVSEAAARAGTLRARRRVGLLLVPESVRVPVRPDSASADTTRSDGAGAGSDTAWVMRRRWRAAPERPWVALP